MASTYVRDAPSVKEEQGDLGAVAGRRPRPFRVQRLKGRSRERGRGRKSICRRSRVTSRGGFPTPEVHFFLDAIIDTMDHKTEAPS